MGAVFAPVGGGSLDKVHAFSILADHLQLEEKPISAIRLDIFRTVWNLGLDFFQQAEQPDPKRLKLYGEGWEMLSDLYEALAEMEEAAMAENHAANLAAFLSARSAEIEQDEAGA